MRSWIANIERHWSTFALPTHQPGISLAERDYWRKRRMLSIALTVTLLFSLATWYPLSPISWAPGAFSTMIILAIILNRHNHFYLATCCYVFTFIAIIAANLLANTHGNTSLLLWEWIPIAFPGAIVGLFLPYWACFIFAGIEFTMITAIFALRHDASSPFVVLAGYDRMHFVIYIFLIVFGMALLSTIFSFILRNAVREVDRSEDLAALNEELELGITELARQHERAAEQQAFLDSILENIAPDILFITDQRDQVLFCNDASLQLFGWQRAEVIGETTRKMFSDKTHYSNFLRKVAQATQLTDSQTRMQIEDELVTRTGEIVRMEINISWLPNLHMYVSLGRDVTARHALEERLQVALAESERTRHELAIIGAVAQACACAAEEAAVAQTALLALMTGLGMQNGILSTRDPHRPGFARLLAIRLDNAESVADKPELVDAYALLPVTPDAELMSIRVLATGVPEFEGVPTACLRSGDGEPYIGPSVYDYSACVPLMLEGAVYGVLGLGYNQSAAGTWTAPERDLLLTVASEIATSLHRARLFEEARRLALFDPHTELHNHRSLQDILQQALREASERNKPFSVIMLDIDHFRKFNELYGHDVGDRALRAVAAAIRATIRLSDFAARYGGEEFTIVLPETPEIQAGEIAERIRQSIAASPIVVDNETVALTASLGYATFPSHASATASLLKAADLALYAAKRSGRDRVNAYTPTLLQSQAKAAQVGDRTALQDISLPSGADMDAVQALIVAIDLRDGYTAAHSDGVARFAVAIAEALRLPVEQIEALRLGSLIHDVGKIGVPDGVLRKPGKLDADEWLQMQAHTTMGEEILRPVEQLHHLIPLVRSHHERLDGSGYPDGLKGDQISLLVRILSVADVFEAFTAERPYHPARPLWEGVQFLRDEVGNGHMDAKIVNVLISVLVCQGMLEEGRQAA